MVYQFQDKFLLGLILVEHTLFMVIFSTTFLGQSVGEAQKQSFGANIFYNSESKYFI